MAQIPVGISGIQLRRSGDRVIVEVEINGELVPVITEQLDANFSHFVHPSGIQEAYQRHLQASVETSLGQRRRNSRCAL